MISKNMLYFAGGMVLLAVIGFVGMKSMFGFGEITYKDVDKTQTYSNNEASVAVGEDAGMPSEWPSDAPENYLGAKMIFSGNSTPEQGRAGAAVSYTVQNVSIQEVADYYKSKLTDNGWTVESNATVGNQIVLGAKKGSKTFDVVIVDGGDGLLTITAGVGN